MSDLAHFIHPYRGFAIVCDGQKFVRVDLTDEQIVRLAAEATKLASDILEARNVRATSPGEMVGGPHSIDSRG